MWLVMLPYPSPIAWEKYRPYLQEEIDTAGMAKDCVKLERLIPGSGRPSRRG
jgi:hypothetical protein